jgi:hypothetical protein
MRSTMASERVAGGVRDRVAGDVEGVAGAAGERLVFPPGAAGVLTVSWRVLRP